jgi:two-component system chemotaxis response regulator CheY
MRQKLESAGYTVLEAVDGEEGLATAVEERPALVISDNNMPHMTGCAMAVELKKRPETACVRWSCSPAAATGSSPSSWRRPISARWLAKPFSARDVLSLVEQILQEV